MRLAPLRFISSLSSSGGPFSWLPVRKLAGNLLKDCVDGSVCSLLAVA